MSHPVDLKSITRLVEIGAGDSWSSQGVALLRDLSPTCRVDLFEPNSILCADLAESLEGLSKINPNVNVYGLALSDLSYEGNLYHLGYASYLAGAQSFIRQSIEDEGEQFWHPLVRPVKVVDVRVYDHGDIDYLVLDCGGSELDILNVLRSRPKIIRTKFRCHNARHWEYTNEIIRWMGINLYQGSTLESSPYQTFFHIEWTKL